MDNSASQHPVERLHLSPRSYNALIRGQITTVEELAAKEKNLSFIHGLGAKGISEIKEKLKMWREAGILPWREVSEPEPIRTVTEQQLQRISESEQVNTPESYAFTNAPSPPTSIEYSSFNDLLKKIINKYANSKRRSATDNSRHVGIILARLTGSSSYRHQRTLEEIGSRFRVTRERVRQICQGFLQFLEGFFEWDHSLNAKLKELKIKLHEAGILSIDTYKGIAKSVFPEFNESELLDFLHILQFQEIVADVSDAIHAAPGQTFLCYINESLVASQIWKALNDMIITENISSVDEVIKRAQADLGIRRELVEAVISLSSSFSVANDRIFIRKGTRRDFSIKDMLFIVLQEENRDLHFSEAAKLVKEYFGVEISPHNAHGALHKDQRFIRIGQGKFSLFNKNLLRGEPEELIEGYLEKQGKLVKFREIVGFIATQRELSAGAVSLALKRSKNIVQVRRGWYGLKKWGGQEIQISANKYPIKMKTGLMAVLEESQYPLSVEELSTKLAEKFGNQCSNKITSITLLFEKGEMKSLVHRDLNKRYFLSSKLL